MAGTPVAEIMGSTHIFVDWYIPNARFADPEVGGSVYVLFGNLRFRERSAKFCRCPTSLPGRRRPPFANALPRRLRGSTSALAPHRRP
jgi:hypothetical protein